MKTAVINIKTEIKLKSEAQKVAEELGLSLSVLINGFLKQIVKTKTVTFSTSPIEEPSEYLIRDLKKSEEDIKEGWLSPGLYTAKEAIAWLDDPNRKYVRDFHKKVRKTTRKGPRKN